jgi:mannose-6-phosphate isomerase
LNPITLAPNQLHRFYRGGARIAALRRTELEDEYAPEDWVGSTTPVFGSDSTGISALPDGRPLPEAIAQAPEEFLGTEHVARFGADPRVLVKLLDAGQRLPVHVHPDRAFAAEHLGSPFGKTEAWYIADAAPGASVRVAFKDDVDEATLRAWVDAQATDSLLGALHEREVHAGDVLFVPAGLPHVIGEGVLIVELQEPSDLSVLLEWEGFEVDGRADGHLGLGFETALAAADRSAADPASFASDRPGALLPAAADPYFRAERVSPGGGEHESEPSFAVLVVLAGEGTLRTDDGEELALSAGTTALVPFAAGTTTVTGDLHAIRCLPPDPDAGEGRW